MVTVTNKASDMQKAQLHTVYATALAYFRGLVAVPKTHHEASRLSTSDMAVPPY